jgi:hypothetical protein
MAPHAFGSSARDTVSTRRSPSPDGSPSAFGSSAFDSSSGGKDAVLLVDPMSTGKQAALDVSRYGAQNRSCCTGAVLALMVKQRGYKCVALYSSDYDKTIMDMVPESCRDGNLTFESIITVRGPSPIMCDATVH